LGGEELGRLEKKMAQAAALMLASGHRLPGVKGWELRRRLGKNYERIIKSLDSRLRQIGLCIKVAPDPDAGPGDLDRARFFIVLSDPLMLSDIQTLGYSLDELAILSATLAYLLAKDGGVPEREVVEMLEAKYPRWRVESALERFARRGYLNRTEEGVISVGWRTLVEVDRQELLKAFAALGGSVEGSGGGGSGGEPTGDGGEAS